jgi:hypothetical protein
LFYGALKVVVLHDFIKKIQPTLQFNSFILNLTYDFKDLRHTTNKK